MNGGRLLDARDLQIDYGLNRRQAYALLSAVGCRITPRRLVVLRERALEYLGGGDGHVGNGDGTKEQAPTVAGGA